MTLFDFWNASRLPIYFENSEIRLDSKIVLEMQDAKVVEFTPNFSEIYIKVWLEGVTLDDIKKIQNSIKKC